MDQITSRTRDSPYQRKGTLTWQVTGKYVRLPRCKWPVTRAGAGYPQYQVYPRLPCMVCRLSAYAEMVTRGCIDNHR
jgi:hypothetical protein